LAMLAEIHAARQQEAGASEVRGNPFLPPPRGSSSRRSRMEDLEDMMMMEAIRLSLASEEERRKKDEKDAKKEAKKKEKESKKAEKAARKNSLFTLNSNTSNAESAGNPMERSQSVSSSILGDESQYSGKGKAVDRLHTPPNDDTTMSEDVAPKLSISGPATSLLNTSQESLSSSFPPLASEPFKRSHLRQMSNASSSASSFVESSGQAFTGSSTPPGGGAGLESMFNFRSLAAMIGDEEKTEGSTHLENPNSPGYVSSIQGIEDKAGPVGRSPSPDSPGSLHPETSQLANGSVKHNGGLQKISTSLTDIT